MLKYIRWKGLIAFVIVIIIFGGFWLLFVDTIVKKSIEKLGTSAVGARVNVAEADLSLFPAGLELMGVQITNPDDPMKNAVEIARINTSIDSALLLRRKVIINEMALEGIRLDTPRKTSGAVKNAVKKSTGKSSPQKPSSKGTSESISLPSSEIPSVKNILEKEELKSLTLISSFQKDITAEREKWDQVLKELPDKKKFEEYKHRIKEIKSSTKGKLGGLLSSAGEAVAIKKEIKRDLKKIKSTVRDFKTKLSTFENRFNQISKAPQKDIERLKNKYSISPKGLANISRLLFGAQLSGWVDKAIAWNDRLQPVLQRSAKKDKGPVTVKPLRGKGVNVRFKEYRPLPDFLIQNVKADVVVKAGNLTGNIKNITPDQDILGIPMTFAFSGENLEKIGVVKLDGKSDYVIPARAQNSINLSVKKMTISDLVLSDDAKFPISLKKALANVDVRAVFRSDNINSNINAAFSGVKLHANPSDQKSLMANVISSALSGVKKFTATVDIDGTFENYDLKIKSDLDQVLKRSVGSIARKESAKLEAELKQAIFAKVNGPLKDSRRSLGGFGNIGEELNKRLGSGSNLLKGGL
jgi:uncharacterized protein (TIGR03545 family)